MKLCTLACAIVWGVGYLLQASNCYAQLSGDELRGAGAYLRGAGWYNLNTAKATSINVDSVIRWKADLRKIQAERRLLVAKSKADKKAKIEEIKQNLLRREYELRTNPSASDVHKGDALDVLLYDLTDPSLSLGIWQGSPVELPDGMSVKELIFEFTPLSGSSSTSTALGRGVIALSRLDIEGRWPTTLRGEELKDERDEFERAYKAVRDKVIAGQFDANSFAQLDNSLDGLKAKVKAALPEERGYRAEGIRLVEDLEKATRMFDATTVDYAREILLDTKDHEAKTVGELVAFMSKYRLQFASAEKYPAQRELYAKLYQAMKLQTEKLGLAPDKDTAISEVAWGSAAQAGRTWNGPTTTKDGKSRFASFWSVLNRDGNKITLLHNGAGAKVGGWQVEGEFVSATEFKLIAAKQLVGKPHPFGPEITGTGTFDGQSLTIDLWFPAAKHGSVFAGKLEEE